MNKIFAWILAVVLLVAAGALAEEMDASRNVRMTISFVDEGAGIPGAEFSIHHVANIDEDGKYKVVAPFDKYRVNIDAQGESALAGVAATLEGYVLRDQIAPTGRASTGEEGMVPFSGGGIKQGLYLVLGRRHVANGKVYTIQPTLVQLPGWDMVNREWVYDVAVSAKYETAPDSGEENPISRKVLKIWDDEEYAAYRPKEIEVQLLRDGEVYDTVKLNAENLWRHTWPELDGKHQWTVVEREMDDYSVIVAREGITFVITNTFVPPPPVEPDDGPTPTPKPTNPPKQPSGGNPPKLPQTGQLWWPVAMLVSVGLLLIVIGLARRRGN